MAHDLRREFYERRIESLREALPGYCPEASRAILNMVWLYDALERRCNSIFNEYGLSLATFNVLSILQERGEVPLKDFSTLLVKTPANITGLIDGLVKRGLVERVPHPEDRRVKLARLLPQGEAMVEEVIPLYHHRIRDLLSVLKPEELKTFTSLAGRLLEHVRSEEEEG